MTARDRRRRARTLHNLLRAVAGPLEVMRRLKQVTMPAHLPAPIVSCFDDLLLLFEGTVHQALRELAALGVSGPRPATHGSRKQLPQAA